jgi:SSS family transporter
MTDTYSISTLNIIIVLGVMVVVTVFGHIMAGGVSTRKDFFNAGGGLPWWAVSTSIMATVISAVTFISVPTSVFVDGGNLFYIQVLFGLMLGKILTGFIFAGPFYRATDCRTVYQFIGKHLEQKIGSFSVYLGLLLTSLNTGVRLLTTALVLSVVAGIDLLTANFCIVGFAILWSSIAGLKTVIWTDFLLFIIFTLGAVFSIFWVTGQVEMSLVDAYSHLDEAAKLALFDFSTDPTRTYTIWAGLIGMSAGALSQAGGQAVFQRIKACRSERDAKIAFIASAALYITPICMLFVGLALSVFYSENPLPQDIVTQLSTEPDRIFPYFIVTELPDGISGIFIAAIFAAGISTIDTHLTEVSDITITDIYEKRYCKNASEAHYLMASRIAILVWGVFYVGMAMFMSNFTGDGLLNLIFKAPNYVAGIILGTVALALLRWGSWNSYLMGVAVAVSLTIFMHLMGVSFFYWPLVSSVGMVSTVRVLEWYRKNYLKV